MEQTIIFWDTFSAHIMTFMCKILVLLIVMCLRVALVVKNPPASAEDTRDMGSIPGVGRFPGEGNDKPLQYSCLENPMDRGA